MASAGVVSIVGLALSYHFGTKATAHDLHIRVRYFAAFLVVIGIYLAIPAAMATTTSNFAGYYRKATATSVYTMCMSFGAICSVYIFRTRDAPGYGVGFLTNLVLAGVFLMSVGLLRLYLARENRRRDQSRLSERPARLDILEKVHGDRSEDFRYIL